MIPVAGSIATPHISAGPTPSEFACRLLVSGTNWPTRLGFSGLLTLMATIPFEYQDEYARSPRTSVLCTDQLPVGVGCSPNACGASVNLATCCHSLLASSRNTRTYPQEGFSAVTVIVSGPGV